MSFELKCFTWFVALAAVIVLAVCFIPVTSFQGGEYNYEHWTPAAHCKPHGGVQSIAADRDGNIVGAACKDGAYADNPFNN
jgi:hypothetical protein